MNDRTRTIEARAKLSELLSLFIAQAMQCDIDALLHFLKQAELTLPLLSVLHVVERRGALTIGELGSSLDYSLANASLLVDKLVCNEYVTRVENSSDRRHKLVQLTPKGQALVAELRATRADEAARQLHRLPPDLLDRTVELLGDVTAELRESETLVTAAQ